MPETLTRRDLFSLRRSPKRIQSGLAPYSGPWTRAQAAHLLRRTLFGPRLGEIGQLAALDAGQAADLLLQTGPAPAPPVNDYANDQISDPQVPFGQTWVEAPYNNDLEYYRIVSLKGWWISRMLTQPMTIEEKMVMFWHNHFATEMVGVFNARMCYRHLALLRTHALGNFKALVKAVTLDPLMLIYLNGAFNEKDAPDENYARELQELFCLGKGPGSQYTEGDVRAAARVLTGWRVNWETAASFFEPYFHDPYDKQFSSFYQSQRITGRSGAAGAEELDDLLDMLFEQAETSKFICRKLYRYFVNHEIDEAVETSVIEPLAQLFRDSGYEILPVLSALLKSAHFYDSAVQGAVIKSPAEYLLGMCRSFGIEFPGPDLLRDGATLRTYLWYFLITLLQDPGDPPNVAGWPAWYQAPQFDRYWATTDTLPRRAQVAEILLYYGFSTDTYQARLDTVAFTATLPQPEDPNALIDDVESYFFGIPFTAEVRRHLKSILLSNQQSDYYWTAAWVSYALDPADEMKRFTVETRLKAFYLFVLQLEEFHLM
ncbi:MAG: DUF1800 domain-containing protein [Bacteroidia bacterium]|nr:DUF1800 domain-containing protein [Bacteroidia bacterium]